MKTDLKKVLVSCYLCGADDTRLIARGTDREYYTTPDEFNVVECKACALRYLNPRPDVIELPTIYPSDYYSYHMDVEPDELGLAARLRHGVHGRRFARVMRHLGPREKVDLMDVGCGDGWMLYLLKGADPARIRTFGIDINPEVCERARARGHTVYCGLFEETNFDQGFDIINLSNVIEHVTDPAGVVRKSWESLRPGGLLILETPNYDSWDARYFRDGSWGSYHIPRHFTFFNASTIAKLGRLAGFELAEITYSPAPTQWVWTIHNLLLKSTSKVLRSAAPLFEPRDCFAGGLKPFLLLGALTTMDWLGLRLTGQTSNMSVVLKKKDG